MEQRICMQENCSNGHWRCSFTIPTVKPISFHLHFEPKCIITSGKVLKVRYLQPESWLSTSDIWTEVSGFQKDFLSGSSLLDKVSLQQDIDSCLQNSVEEIVNREMKNRDWKALYLLVALSLLSILCIDEPVFHTFWRTGTFHICISMILW